MSFFDNIGKTISDVSQGAIQKGKGMADVVKFNSLISEEEKKINGLYQEIGKKYVEQYGAAPAEDLKEYVDQVYASKEKIAEYQEKVTELKGITRCPSCGAEVPNGAAFCSVCGAKMEEKPANPAEPADTLHCTSCGAVISPGSKFCTSCGKPVER